MIMNEVFDLYETECLPELSWRVARDYRGMLVYLRRAMGHLAPHAVTPRIVVDFHKASPSKVQRNRMLMLLSLIFKRSMGSWCIDMNLANPCIPVRRNRTYARKRYVTDEEFHEFRAGATYPMQIAMDFALLIGQRQSDITQLRWDQIHIATPGDGWYAGEMIDGKFVQTCFGHIDIDQGKTGKRLAIAISASVYAVLARAWLLIEPQTASECLIQNKFRRRYTPDSFRALWQKYMRAWRAIHCGVSGWTFHDLRAKCVSDNKSLAAASLLAGHRNQTITGSVYDRNRRRAEPLR